MYASVTIYRLPLVISDKELGLSCLLLVLLGQHIKAHGHTHHLHKFDFLCVFRSLENQQVHKDRDDIVDKDVDDGGGSAGRETLDFGDEYWLLTHATFFQVK